MGIVSFKLLSRLGKKPEHIRAAIQGFGNVGSHTARFLADGQCKIVAVSDVSGGYYRREGLDVADLLTYSREHRGSLAGYPHAEPIGNDELLALDVDLLIPAALGGVITRENVERIRAPLIVEAANAPVLVDADEVLEARGVTVVPDILANAGGVTASYFAWVQNRQHYQWSVNRVRQELDRVMAESFEKVWEKAQQDKCSLRMAAYMLGIGRVGRATILGGIK